MSSPSDSSLAAYLLDSVKAAFSLQGAVDEDHRQLRQLQSDVNATIPQIDRLLGALSEDISRQSVYVGNERQNLVALSLAIKNGELYGQGNTVRTPPGAADPDGRDRSAVRAPAARRHPLRPARSSPMSRRSAAR